MRFYLAGPVGYAQEGTSWKDEMKTLLRSKGHEVYDPIENDGKYPRVVEMNKLKENSKANHTQIKEIMQQIFIDDCAFITDCDYIICYFLGRSYGTTSEQGIAYYLNRFYKKDIKTICIFDESFNPDEWIICCSDHIFLDIKSAIKFLKEIK